MRQQEARYEDQEHAIDTGMALMQLRRQHEGLEQAYTQLQEEHRQCAPPASAVRPGEAWAWRFFIDALGAAYRDAATQYHPDRHASDRQMEDKMTDISTAYMEIVHFMRRHVAGV
jgi:hypothetical protein